MLHKQKERNNKVEMDETEKQKMKNKIIETNE